VRNSGGAVTRTSARVIEANRSGQTYAAKVAGRTPSLLSIDSSIEYLIAALVPEVSRLTDRLSPEPDDRCVGIAIGLIPTLHLAIPASLH
jgi:hypothetical protein